MSGFRDSGSRVRRSTRWLCVFAMVVSVCPPVVQAGGLYHAARGSLPLGRGGVGVVQVEPGHALWYNPAGLSGGGRQLLADGTLSLLRSSFTRRSRDDVNQPDGQHPKVEGSLAPLPIPTLAYSDDLGLRGWDFGAAVLAPNALMLDWPETVNGAPAPQRHALISMRGTALASLALGASWTRGDLSVGAGLHLIGGRFRALVTMSACDAGTLCQHVEDPEWEAPAVIDLERTVTATGILGLRYKLGPLWLGGSLMLPYSLSGAARIDVALPDAPLFLQDAQQPARVEGDRADVEIAMPMVARLGLGYRFSEEGMVELDLVHEGWSVQRELSVQPRDVAIVDALGLERYEVGPISMPRGMEDVISVRLGAEHALPVLGDVVLRGGLSWESSAIPDRTLTVLTLDSEKWMLAAGASVAVAEGLWLDLLYAHLFMRDREVRDSQVYPQNPLSAPPAAGAGDPEALVAAPEAIGNGVYTMESDLIGLGLRWEFGARPASLESGPSVQRPRVSGEESPAAPPAWPDSFSDPGSP